jgi:hypothetical protein
MYLRIRGLFNEAVVTQIKERQGIGWLINNQLEGKWK